MPSVATIADVARRAGVSISTVSRVMSPGLDPHPVRAATAERVRQAARELNFVPSPLARGLAVGRSGLIGLVVPDLTDPHYPQIARGVEDAAREADMAVLICNTLGDPLRLSDYVQLLYARRVDAIILSGATSLTERDVAPLQRFDVPLVLIGRPPRGVTLPHVGIDNQLAARLATWHLIERGAQAIAHLAGPTQQTTMLDRMDGYRQAMQVAGLQLDIIQSDGTPEHGYTQVQGRFGLKRKPRAIFAATDRLAIACMAFAIDAGLRVPDDLAIIGFDDIALSDQLRPRLSTVAQPAREMGRRAIELAQRLLAGETVQPVLLQASLVPRTSTLGVREAARR